MIYIIRKIYPATETKKDSLLGYIKIFKISPFYFVYWIYFWNSKYFIIIWNDWSRFRKGLTSFAEVFADVTRRIDLPEDASIHTDEHRSLTLYRIYCSQQTSNLV